MTKKTFPDRSGMSVPGLKTLFVSNKGILRAGRYNWRAAAGCNAQSRSKVQKGRRSWSCTSAVDFTIELLLPCDDAATVIFRETLTNMPTTMSSSKTFRHQLFQRTESPHLRSYASNGQLTWPYPLKKSADIKHHHHHH